MEDAQEKGPMGHSCERGRDGPELAAAAINS